MFTSSTCSARKIKQEEEDDHTDSSGWSASLYNKTASFVYSAPFVAPVLNLLDAQPGERILDLGCGSGEVSLTIEKIVQQRAGGVVVGVDASESMILKAKENGLRQAFVCDVQDLKLPHEIYNIVGSFDAVFSNATLHWCKQDPLGVLNGARAVLRPGGRLVVEMGGFMNCIGVRGAVYAAVRRRGYDPAPLDPWYFPSIEDYVKLLVTAGFEPTHLSLTPRITPLPTGLMEWLKLFVRNSFLRIFNDRDAAEIMREVEEHCRVDCQDASGKWALTYMRLRLSAVVKS
ncbi:cyclopropane-fatty-acyl-phospholipid synthase [Coprinopsis marcescibilis]|uniref:Cyclopropane-fatty-acyl-phospholipid synthase n=1 Tax=Coprinopsis marcescibilis TaxID=230819 RepID=A0A5C3KIW0_COPMA|nr:cyclopropane-fatty-acyl-phospholipid synthase [Coprinopsis marcescibilis]